MADVPLPLDTTTSTRLMILEPGAYYQPIRCRLVEVDLDDNPDYEALSYTWGDATDEETVHVNGIAFRMRSNLSSFLRRLRHMSIERTFWVDVLSISQIDLHEKSRQVAMIGRVFKQAICVRAWVGEHADNSEALFRADFDPLSGSSWKWVAIARTRLHTIPTRRAIVLAMTSCTVGLTLWVAIAHIHGDVSYGLVLVYASLPVAPIAALLLILGSIIAIMLYSYNTQQDLWYQVPEWYSFTHRQWFRRIWIVQEVALARHLIVHCGCASLSWQDLITTRIGSGTGRTIDRAASVMTGSVQLRDHPVVLLHLLRENRNQNVIAVLAYVTRHLQCFDDRDRIYAFLSMESLHSFAEPIIPDYTISVPELCTQIYRLTKDVDRPDSGPTVSTRLYCIMKGLKITLTQYRMVYRLLKPHERHVFWDAIAYKGFFVGTSAFETADWIDGAADSDV